MTEGLDGTGSGRNILLQDTYEILLQDEISAHSVSNGASAPAPGLKVTLFPVNLPTEIITTDRQTSRHNGSLQGMDKTPSRAPSGVVSVRYRSYVKVKVGDENENTSKEDVDAELF